MNRLVEVVSPQGTLRYAYDAAGRLAAKTLPNGIQVAYQYDAADRNNRIIGDRPRLFRASMAK